MQSKMTAIVQEIRRIRQDLRSKPVTVSNKSVVFPRGTIILIFVLAAMFSVPWVLTKVTEFNEGRRAVGRGAGAAGGGVLPSGAETGGASARPRASAVAAATTGGEARYEIYYAPDVNLEKEDVTVVATAHERIDAALYSATDYAFCDALADAAKHGVKVRVYRDHEQYQEESSRARGRQTCSGELVAAGAAVKVKGTAELMHLKSYAVDGKVLRSGSANLSESGEKRQDNDVIFLGSSAAVNGFERDFESMWDREDNEAVGPR